MLSGNAGAEADGAVTGACGVAVRQAVAAIVLRLIETMSALIERSLGESEGRVLEVMRVAVSLHNSA
jgi:hypothetical protein